MSFCIASLTFLSSGAISVAKPNQEMKLSESGGEAEKHRRFVHELQNMMSSLNQMGSEKAGPSHYEEKEKEEDGIRAITLSGSNLGATMKTELDNNNGDGKHEIDFLSTFVNSNFQAVNNSLMIGDMFETNDPGVHLDISEKKPSMNKAPATARESREKKGKTSATSDR